MKSIDESDELYTAAPAAAAVDADGVFRRSRRISPAGDARRRARIDHRRLLPVLAGDRHSPLGHLRHRDGTRNLIYNGGTSFLIGLLFGDVTGSAAVIFATRSLVSASYSREAEQNADTFSIDVMHRLGRPTKAMGELLFRVTGKEMDKTLSILSNHPLTEDRLQRMRDEDRPANGPPLLTAQEWTALKAICATHT
jgi:hypothetical protein